MCTFRKYDYCGEISPFLKIHGTHVALWHGPGIRRSGMSPKYVERTSVRLSNKTKIIKNGLLTSARDDRKVDTSKIVGSCSDNIDSRPRNTGDWHHSVLSHKQGGVAIQRHHGRGQSSLRLGTRGRGLKLALKSGRLIFLCSGARIWTVNIRSIPHKEHEIAQPKSRETSRPRRCIFSVLCCPVLTGQVSESHYQSYRIVLGCCTHSGCGHDYNLIATEFEP